MSTAAYPRRSGRLLLSLSAVAMLAACGAPASVGPLPDPDRIYGEGLRAMDDGDYDAACTKLEEVTTLVPDGLGAKLELGTCYELARKPASAWEQYMIVARRASDLGQWERAAKARARGLALEPKLAKLTVVVPLPAQGIDGITVLRGGALLGASQWGSPSPVDAGRISIEVMAPGHALWRTDVVILSGEKKTIAVEAPRSMRAITSMDLQAMTRAPARDASAR
jgi:tetratricopeptide (TPR) repeat protein